LKFSILVAKSPQVNKICMAFSQQQSKSQQGGSILETCSNYHLELWILLRKPTTTNQMTVCEKSSWGGCGSLAIAKVLPPGGGWWRWLEVQPGETTLSWPGGLLLSIPKVYYWAIVLIPVRIVIPHINISILWYQYFIF